MESQIERMPFFKGYNSDGTAIVDPAVFNAWLDNLGDDARLTPQDEEDRRIAFAELTRGESLDLAEAMKEW